MNNDLNSLIDLLQNMINKFIAREKKPHDYGTGELLYRFETHIIDFIGRNPDINLKGITEKMNVTKGAISQVVNKLVRKNYVNKMKDMSNRRQIKLNLTKKGRIVFEEHKKFHERLNSIIITRFPNFSPVKKKFFMDVLVNINRTFDEL